MQSANIARSATRLTCRSGKRGLRTSRWSETILSRSVALACRPAPSGNRPGPLGPPCSLQPVHHPHGLNFGRHRTAASERRQQVSKAPILPVQEGNYRRFNDPGLRWRGLQAPATMNRLATAIDGDRPRAYPKRPVAPADASTVGLALSMLVGIHPKEGLP